MVMFIYPQHAPAGGPPGRPRFQAHLVLETNSHFRLIDHWKRTLVSGSSCIGQFFVWSSAPQSRYNSSGHRNAKNENTAITANRTPGTPVANALDTPVE